MNGAHAKWYDCYYAIGTKLLNVAKNQRQNDHKTMVQEAHNENKSDQTEAASKRKKTKIRTEIEI